MQKKKNPQYTMTQQAKHFLRGFQNFGWLHKGGGGDFEVSKTSPGRSSNIMTTLIVYVNLCGNVQQTDTHSSLHI
jgi:hypothetical protein